MKYVILRRRPGAGDEPSAEVAVKRGEADLQLPFTIESQDLRDRDAGDLRQDPTVEEVIPSIPFTLIAPVAGPVAEETDTAWGIDAVGAGQCAQDGRGVTVAVLDTGIDTEHAAFSGLTFDPQDLMDFTADERGVAGSAPDLHGHGTHAAATIFGRELNGVRIGVAPGVTKVLIGKVLGPQGGPTETVLNAMEWALLRRADVISMSLGMDFPGVVARLVTSGLPVGIATSRALEAYRSTVRLFDRLSALIDARVTRGRGALVVAASGNESRRDEDARFTVATAPPAAADGFISVGALSKTADQASPFVVAPFSNTGCLLAAPGVRILSAKLGGGLVTMSGTSMATPHVAGVLALWTHKLFPNGERPNGWARDVQLALESKVSEIRGQVRNDVGRGIVQAPRPSDERARNPAPRTRGTH